ncbi:MAG: hypothetical protein DMF24_12350 [Verrucomicrobia bacterium]|nr:MAG: hypothetical protein DME90_02300 [Verrucomicrobiota bacterium]PYL59738.1 MAG: hypothetical protein DMF24_12350 [Verrucomicrobiota bacterium]
MNDLKIDRLLRSAAQAGDQTEIVMPFGFDTRVIALWCAGLPTANGVASLVRRAAALSAAVIVIATIAAVREAKQSREIGESFANEFAIADTAIQDEFSQ